jgi:DNA-binding NarL/FixJ family response regulator
MTIIIADDHPIFLAGLRDILVQAGHSVIGAYANGNQALAAIQKINPDLVVIDISMPGMTGLEVLAALNKPQMPPVVLLTMHRDPGMYQKAVDMGAKGYLLKEFAIQELIKCVDTVAAGGTYFSDALSQHFTYAASSNVPPELANLTPKELKILKMIAENNSSAQIAEVLFISEKTVENIRSAIIKKLNIHNANSRSLMAWALSNREMLQKIF